MAAAPYNCRGGLDGHVSLNPPTDTASDLLLLQKRTDSQPKGFRRSSRGLHSQQVSILAY